MRGARIGTVLASVASLALAGCTASRSVDDPPPWAHLSWQAAALPVPAGSRAMVRGATWCGRWAVAGATADTSGQTRPAVWTSDDGRHWSGVRLDPGGDWYAAHAILTSVGCSHGRLAALGAKPGGAHGLPRTATWRQREDGSLAAVRAPYVLYGGTNSVAVSQLVGGPDGFLVTGTRTSGAAVWTSPDGTAFRLHEGVPGLASTPTAQTQAAAAADAPRGGWVVAGTSTGDDGRVRAMVWVGRGGTWRGGMLPGGGTISTGQSVVDAGSGPVVAGLLDDRFGLWQRRGGGWTLEGTFGERDAEATSAAYVSGLAWTGTLLAATYSDGRVFRLAVGGGSPGSSELPEQIGVSGDHTVTIATHDADALLLTDDGRQGRVWLARVPGPVS